MNVHMLEQLSQNLTKYPKLRRYKKDLDRAIEELGGEVDEEIIDPDQLTGEDDDEDEE